MAKLDIKKKSTDKSTVVGSIVEMNVKRDEEAKAPWDSELGKGGYSKAEFKNPMFRIKVEREDGDVIVDMDSFPILDKSRDFKSNNVQDNATAKVIQQLLDMKNDVVDEIGNWTKKGITALGLYAQEMERAKYRAEQYGKEIEYLNQEYAAGKYSVDEYNEKLQELTI